MDKDNFPDLGNSASHSRANTRQESRPLAPDPPSGCTASAATLGVRGSIGSVLVSISTGELLRKESFVLLEKRKCRGEQWETALRIIIHRKPLNTGFKSTVETQLVTDSEKHKCECGWQSGVADEPGWEIFCLQVTVGSGRPTARQSRFTLLPSFTVTGEEIFTMRAGTADRREGQ